jgi:hypothetical protein
MPFRVDRIPGVAFDPGFVLAVAGLLPGVRLTALPAVADVTAQQHHRAERRHRQQVDLAQEIGHGHAEHDRDDGHQDRHRAPLGLSRRARQSEPDGLPGRQQPRRPVELQARAVFGRVQRGIRRLIRHQVQQRIAHGDLLPGPPDGRRFHRLPVEQHRRAASRHHIAALRIKVQAQRHRRDRRISDNDARRLASQLIGRTKAADGNLPERQLMYRPRGGPAGDTQFGHASRLRPPAPSRIADADDRTVHDRRTGQPHVARHPVIPDEQGQRCRPAVQDTAQLRRDIRNRRVRAGVDHDVRPPPRRR